MEIPEHWIEIENIFHDFPNYDCFVCSPSHATGFRLRFFHDPVENVTVAPAPAAGAGRAGFPGVLHGGFQAMLLDEIMCWAALHFEKKIVFTGKLSVRLAKPLSVDAPFLVKGRVDKAGSRMLSASAVIEVDGQARVTGEGTFFIPTAADFAKTLGLENIHPKYLAYLRS